MIRAHIHVQRLINCQAPCQSATIALMHVNVFSSAPEINKYTHVTKMLDPMGITLNSKHS